MIWNRSLILLNVASYYEVSVWFYLLKVFSSNLKHKNFKTEINGGQKNLIGTWRAKLSVVSDNLICFSFFVSGTCLWIQPKIQRGQIHHWTRSHDKGEWLGLTLLFVSTAIITSLISHCQNCAGTVLAVKKLFIGKKNSLYCLN